MVFKILNTLLPRIMIILLIFVTSGCIGGIGSPSRDIGVIKVDRIGQMEWVTTVNTGEDDFASSIIQAADGGYAVAGTMMHPGAVDPVPRLIKISSKGLEEWDQKYTAIEDQLSVVNQTPEGYYVGLTEHRGKLLFIDRFGNFIEYLDPNLTAMYFPQTNIPSPPSRYPIQSPIIQTSDNRFVTAGFFRATLYSDGYFGPYGMPIELLSIDSSGKPLWNRTLQNAGNWNYVRDLIATQDGGYVILVIRSGP